MPQSTGSPDDLPAPGRLPGVAALTALFAAEILALSALALPNGFRFSYIAFEDLGGTVIVQRLLDEGLRPAVDFYYPYGLLPLLVGRVWFGLFGRSPTAYFASGVACNLLVAWALARFVSALRVPAIGVAVLVVVMPQAVRPVYLNLTHALEAALLCHALASQARGRRGEALALVTACAFVKPTMAYVHGFLLVCLVVRDLWARRAWSRAEVLNAFAPAIVVGALAAALVVGSFGVGPMLAIQIPTKGGLSYKIMDYGFFHRRGREFLSPAGARLGYYAGTYAATWVVTSLAVTVGGLAAAWRLATRVRTRGEQEVRDEVVACCAALHAAFVCLFFSMWWDWGSYFIIPILGLVAMIGRGRAWTLAIGLFLLMALVGHRLWAFGQASAWSGAAPSPQTAGLWASAKEREEWGHVLTLTEGRTPLLLKLSGCGEQLFPGFQGTSSWYLHPLLVEALSPPSELDRIVSRLEAARAVVVVRGNYPPFTDVPRIRHALEGCTRVMEGKHFEVYLRDSPRP